jgi:hypothetical protein
VSKLLKLKDWLTIADASRHLSNMLEEKVSEADVFQLGLDGHLRLSVNLVNHAAVRRARVVPLGQAKMYVIHTDHSVFPPMVQKDVTTSELGSLPDEIHVSSYERELSL